MLSNYINNRGCILADEMGLGKTLQTAATLDIISLHLEPEAVFLIVAPLSTLAHWKREFESWTDLNVIVYHGSQEDREAIRTYEMAYECDRPATVGMNQQYLRKCLPKKGSRSPWMVDVVVTTPEVLIAVDAMELAAITWTTVIVDEAHRLKNDSSKLGKTMRDKRFNFGFKMLLTGTPIQNTVEEFFTLLNFIDPDTFSDAAAFLERYGDMKSKESLDDLHDQIRPYILRRLKGDVEKSVPPKEETVIEVELTLAQKQYYRALYEQNVQFLHKNKSRALDGPSLNNLAMQLRKCCNHLFLLNGIEEEYRRQQRKSDEGDVLASASGKLVLLDKLLPRLRSEGHRVLLFSQFKIMLDILEDYFVARGTKFERIDGSITGHKRQQAIDRFQAPALEGKEQPFIMMLSTRAGGVGINLTAADVCIIFDSDWNPQNDLQAQARCHRIGQTKHVTVYRLLSRKTYEMKMFHQSSLKMGLDQAVLNKFEGGASGQQALSKEEVERLLKCGAYEIFSEDKAGNAESESNAFIEQDIDQILAGRSRKVVHEDTGSHGRLAGGTFSKASYKAKTLSKDGEVKEDVDLDDPDFWKKIVGEPKTDVPDSAKKPRQRARKNYSETAFSREFEKIIAYSDQSDIESEGSDSSESSFDSHAPADAERCRWGGPATTNWKKESVERLIKALQVTAYGNSPWQDVAKLVMIGKELPTQEVHRMSWALLLYALSDIALENAVAQQKREEKALTNAANHNVMVSSATRAKSEDIHKRHNAAFAALWESHVEWASIVLADAVEFAKSCSPRRQAVLDHAYHVPRADDDQVSAIFASNVWPSLKSRGWSSEKVTEAGKLSVQYNYGGKKYGSINAVLVAASTMHSELINALEGTSSLVEKLQNDSVEAVEFERTQDLSLNPDTVDVPKILRFLERYGPLQLVADRKRAQPLRLPRKLLTIASLLDKAKKLVTRAQGLPNGAGFMENLAASLAVDKRTALPHARWTPFHDATLICAILKHGWIEDEAACHAITEDNTIKWGFPFDDQSSHHGEASKDIEIIGAAERAALALNVLAIHLNDVKGLDVDLLARIYALERPDIDPAAGPSHGSTFTVNKQHLANLLAARADEAKELPPKRDLIKRAKAIIQRTQDNTFPSLAPSAPAYPLLDQTDPCNILLAQLLRTILRTPSPGHKTVMKLAYDEAEARAAELGRFGRAESAADMRTIVQNIDLVRRHKASRAAKNIVRVIMGEEPHNRPDEPTFASDRVALQPLPVRHMPSPKKVASPARTEVKRNVPSSSKSMADRAIERAQRRATQPFSKTSNSNDSSSIELTEVETILLATLAHYGIPIWSPQWEKLMSCEVSPKFVLDWGTVGQAASKLAEDNVTRADAEIARIAVQEQKLNHPTGMDARPALAAAKKSAAQTAERKRQCLDQARGYADDIDMLTKKVLMLLAKMNGYHIASMTNKNLAMPHAKFLRSEIVAWSKAVDMTDDNGEPHAFVAMDFLEELDPDDRGRVEISATFSIRKDEVIMHQMALVTRLRWLFLNGMGSQWNIFVRAAVDKLTNTGHQWAEQPEGWVLRVHDGVLIMRLLDSGFAQLLDSSKHFDHYDPAAKLSFRMLKVASDVLQKRAGVLLTELELLVQQCGPSEGQQLTHGLSSFLNQETSSKTQRQRQTSPKPAPSPAPSSSSLSSIEIVDPPRPPQAMSQDSRTSQVADVEYSDVEVVAPPKRKSDGSSSGAMPPSAEKKHKSDGIE